MYLLLHLFTAVGACIAMLGFPLRVAIAVPLAPLFGITWHLKDDCCFPSSRMTIASTDFPTAMVFMSGIIHQMFTNRRYFPKSP